MGAARARKSNTARCVLSQAGIITTTKTSAISCQTLHIQVPASNERSLRLLLTSKRKNHAQKEHGRGDAQYARDRRLSQRA